MLSLPFQPLQPARLTVVPCIRIWCLSHVLSHVLAHPFSRPQSRLPHQLATLLPASVQTRVANTQRCVDGSPVYLLNTSHRKEEWGFASVKFYLSQTLNPIFLMQSRKMVSIQLSREECFRLNSAPWTSLLSTATLVCIPALLSYSFPVSRKETALHPSVFLHLCRGLNSLLPPHTSSIVSFLHF